MSRVMIWSADADARLTALRAEGLADAVIAARLAEHYGVPITVGAVGRRAQRLGCQKRPPSWRDHRVMMARMAAIRDEDILRLHAQGMAALAIARHFDVSYDAMRRRMAALIDARTARQKLDLAAVQALHEAGLAPRDIAARFGVTKSSVNKALTRIYLDRAERNFDLGLAREVDDEHDRRDRALQACQDHLADLRRAHPRGRYPSIAVGAGLPARIGPAITASLIGSTGGMCAEVA